MKKETAYEILNREREKYEHQWVQDRSSGEKKYIYKMWVEEIPNDNNEVKCDFGNGDWCFFKDVPRGYLLLT